MWSDVEAVPAVADQLERLGQRQRRAERARRQRARADDHRRPLRHPRTRRPTALGSLPSSSRSSPSHSTLHAEVDFRPDGEHLGALAHRLAQPRVDQRRFPARVGADQQDRVGILDPGDGRVERHRGEARDVIVEPGLPPFEQARPLPCEQRLRRIHRLGVEQIAGDRRDLRPGLLQLARRTRRAPRPSSPRAACPSRAPTAGRAGRGPAHRHGGASCRATHSSFTSSLIRGRMRITWRWRTSRRMLEPTASITSIAGTLRSSHGRASKL